MRFRSLLWLCCVYAAVDAYVGTKCMPLKPGDACQPNTHDVIILSNASASECLGACEAQAKNGCCWHSPKGGVCKVHTYALLHWLVLLD